jgi:hypothetical protein
MNTTMKKILMISILAATIASCSSDDDNNPATPVGELLHLNEWDYSATDLEIVLGLLSLPVGEYS